MSNSLRPQGPQPTRHLYPWNSPGKNTGVGCHFLLQGIFLTQGLNPGLPHRRQTLYQPPGREEVKGRLGARGSTCVFPKRPHSSGRCLQTMPTEKARPKFRGLAKSLTSDATQVLPPPPPTHRPRKTLTATCHGRKNKTPPFRQQASLWLSGWRIRLQCGRPGLHPRVGKVPWRRERPPYSRILAWRIPWTVQSVGLQRVGHD